MTNCPPRLRGDLSKWLCEINTGVYVGNVSARVRDTLWERVCQNIKNGQATMVFTTSGEQRMDFRTHNTTWEAVDYDGIKLMRRPLTNAEFNENTLKPGFSNAAKYAYTQGNPPNKANMNLDYTVIDLETTGLDVHDDEIIEYGAIRIRNGEPVASFASFVHIEKNLPKDIIQLTGIQPENLMDGKEPQEALREFLLFIGNDILVGHTISFDMEFLREACKRMNVEVPSNRCYDIAKIARKKLHRISNYKLLTLVRHYQLGDKIEHRAIPDCRIIYEVYCKLNE